MMRQHPSKMNKKTALFLCTHNSGRSQIAESLLHSIHGNQWEAFSAGTDPRSVHPCAVTVMAEIGIDISKNQSKHVASFLGKNFDLVVTVCDGANEACPIFPGGTKRRHRSFPDPSAAQGTLEERLVIFRRIRDEICDYIKTDVIFTASD
jgi:arsenate reductase